MQKAGENGRAAAEDALEHWPQAFGFALSLCGDRARAEDLCQESFLRLATMKREVDRSRPLRPLLFRILRNLHVSELRRSKPDPLDAEPPDPEGSGPAEAASRRERIRRVRAALDRLSPEWRSMLYLRDGVGLSYREIAGVVGRSVGVVRVTLHRARKRVRSHLGRMIREDTES